MASTTVWVPETSPDTYKAAKTGQRYEYAPRYPFVMRNGLLSRAYVTPFVISLLFLIWRLYLNYAAVDVQTQELRMQIMGECHDVERMTDEFLALQVVIVERANDFYLRFINYTIEKTLRILIGVLDILATVFVQFVTAIQSVVTCLGQAIARVALKALAQQAEKIQDFLQKTVDFGADATNAVAGGLETAINKLKDVFSPQSKNVEIPRVKRIELPFDLKKSLESIDVPKDDVVGEKLQELLMKPVELAKQELDRNIEKFRVHQNLFPVPVGTNVTFCAQVLDFRPLEAMSEAFKVILLVCMGFVVLAILISVAFQCLVIYRRFRWYEQRVERFSQDFHSHPYAMDQALIHGMYYTLNRGAISDWTRWSAVKMARSKTAGNGSVVRIRWLLDYIFHKPSLMCMFVGLFGVILGSMQLYGIDRIEETYLPQMHDSVNQTAFGLLSQVNLAISERTTNLITEANSNMVKAENEINGAIFQPAADFADRTNRTFVASLHANFDHLRDHLHLGLFADFLEDFSTCFLDLRLEGFLRILKVLESMEIHLPQLEQTMFQLSKDRLEHAGTRMQSSLLGVQEGVRWVGGVIPRFLDEWRRRARQEVFFSGLTVAFGCLVLVQGMVGFTYFSFRR